MIYRQIMRNSQCMLYSCKRMFQSVVIAYARCNYREQIKKSRKIKNVSISRYRLCTLQPKESTRLSRKLRSFAIGSDPYRHELDRVWQLSFTLGWVVKQTTYQRRLASLIIFARLSINCKTPYKVNRCILLLVQLLVHSQDLRKSEASCG